MTEYAGARTYLNSKGLSVDYLFLALPAILLIALGLGKYHGPDNITSPYQRHRDARRERYVPHIGHLFDDADHKAHNYAWYRDKVLGDHNYKAEAEEALQRLVKARVHADGLIRQNRRWRHLFSPSS